MKLYYSPGTCSIGIHILLEEIGEPYELVKVDFAKSEQYSPEFKQINPKSKVPALALGNGVVLTEFQAIAYWLSQTYPDKKLLPANLDVRMKCMSMTDYVVSTIHPQAFGRQFRPANFTARMEDHDVIKARGAELATNAFKIIDDLLPDDGYVGGEFSYADVALFYVEFWQARRLGLELPRRCSRHFETMRGRTAVQAVLAQEGFA